MNWSRLEVDVLGEDLLLGRVETKMSMRIRVVGKVLNCGDKMC